MDFVIASGPVIIEDEKLLVIKDKKDDFYKIPGGRVEFGESLEETCVREVKEELNAEIEIIKPLNPMVIYKNPQTNEEMTIVLIHYLARLKTENLKVGKNIKEFKWLNIQEIKDKKHEVAPNVNFLINKGDIK